MPTVKVSATITATDYTDGKKISTNISDINPEATNQNIKTFAQMLNSLTTNTYVETTKITKETIY